MEAAAETSGSRFAYLLGDLVMVELALVRFALETAARRGLRPRLSAGAGARARALRDRLLPRRARDDLRGPARRAVPRRAPRRSRSPRCTPARSSRADELPLRYAGFSTCFRREAGAAGRDTRGIFRVHQFDKVEMFSFVEPAASDEEHERLLALQERILGALEIPYRVVDIPVGDLGASAARKFDCEAWIPSQGRYREVTSCSNTTDYQARRLNCRYRPAEGASPEPVHTLNGTAVAVGRTLIALLENGQEGDGTVSMPAVLQEFRRSRAHSHTYEPAGLQSESCSATTTRSSARPSRPGWPRSTGVEIVGEAETGEEVVGVVNRAEARRLHRRRRAARPGRDRGDHATSSRPCPRPG